MTEEIHDMSRVDSFMASRRRAMFFHSVWKPMLAGAVGAAIMSAAVIGSVWVILPKISTRDVVVDHVVPHDVPFDNHTPQDKPFDNYVPQPKPFDVPVPKVSTPPTSEPQANLPPKPVADTPPATPAEQKFVNRPEYTSADFKGRLEYDKDGFIRFIGDNDNVFFPSKLDPMGVEADTGVADPTVMYDTRPFWGDFAFCNKIPSKKNLFKCLVIHNDVVSDLQKTLRFKTATDRPCAYGYKCDTTQPTPTANAPQPSPKSADANGMINVDVVLDGYGKIVNAMVDTGCSFPLSITPSIADALLRNGEATQSQPMKTTLADGSTHGISVITIKTISVDGRVLHDVDAGVGESEKAPILLGLGALNRLGPYTIGDGRIVFTGEPA